MQLKRKKIGIISTIIVYFATFLMQSNFELLNVFAGESSKPRVNIVTILVDDKIYDQISEDLEWYASSYIQQKLSDTQTFILPLKLETVSAYDIHRMMENIYFDGLEDVNSSLIGLIMVGNIPLPVVNQDGYVFPTVYPYVDFENQKYVWDSEIKYFVPNGNAGGQAEIWHGLINYGTDASAYKNFFLKIREYNRNPNKFIGDAMWYEDFIAEKEGFLNENYKYYRNKMMFAEDLGYQRYSPLMKSLFNTESTDNSLELLDQLADVSNGSEGSEGSPSWIDFEIPTTSSDEHHTTKLIQQEIQDGYLADYSELFSKVALTTRRENIFAGGRWIKTYENDDGVKNMEVDADSSLSMVQLKDTLYLGNDNLVGIIQNLNNILEKYVDDKIESEKYSMDLVIPVEYRQEKGKKIKLALFPVGCYSFITDYKNYYFGKEARYVDNVKDLSIYRGTFRNLTGIDGLNYSDLTGGKNPAIGSYDKTDLKKKSIGASYDIFSNQVEGNRGYVMMSVQNDVSEYYENKTRALHEEKTRCVPKFLCKVRRKSWPSRCDEDNCETLNEFAERRWGGASPINLDFSSLSGSKYRLSGYAATDSWRPIFDMGGYQSLSSGKDEGISGTGWIHGTGTGPQWDATNFKSYIKYSSPTEVEGWDRRKRGYRVYYNHMPNVHDMSFSDMNYWTLPTDKLSWNFKQESDKIFTIENSSRVRLLSCGSSEKYTYKFVSSVVKHDSTSDDEINGIDRDLYGDTGKLGGYYADVESAYFGLYQDIQAIVLSGEDLILSLDEKGLELSGYISQLKSVVLGNRIEGDVSEVLSGVENVLTGSKNELINLYSSISSLIVDDIVGTLEHIIYTEGGDIEGFYEDSDFKSSVKIPFLSSWIVNINSFTNMIMDSRDSLLELYDNAYATLDSIKTQWVDFYSGYESRIEISAFNERFFELNSGFQNIFIVYPDEEEDEDEYFDANEEEGNTGGENIDNEDEEQGSEDEDEEGEVFFVLNSGSVLEPVELLVSSFTGTTTGVNDLFLQFFEVDGRGNQIILEAKKDSDFKSRCRDEGIDIEGLTQAELITEYAKWAKGDGYDSAGAKKNHDLLVGVVEHISGMNLLTPDRPIDSPRYVSMQAINGKEVKLIYPDLFKVEVFELKGKNKSGYDIHVLLTGAQIKENLVKYIKNKVVEYNALLSVDELPDNVYYGKILQFDEYATPYKSKRPYKLFTYDEVIEAIGGEQMLDVIADVLYYQNLTNKKKLSSSGVNEDISFIKKSFNLNDKRENVLEDYLTEKNEEKKHPLLVIPKYELSGYEVAYVNSNGGDYIIPVESITGDATIDNQNDNYHVKVRRYGSRLSPSPQDDKCNVPSNGRLPLFGSPSWLDGFLCRWEETKKNPLKLELSFDSSLGEVVTSNGFDDFMKSLGKALFSETKDSLTDWKDARSDYVDEWKSLLGMSSERDSDARNTQIQVEAENHNRIVLSGDSGVSNALSDISNNVVISNSNAQITDNNPVSILEISSMSYDKNITVVIEGTGDGCLSLNESDICPGDKFQVTFNPKSAPFSGVVKSSDDHKAGSSAFIIKYGFGGDDYIEKVIKYTVSPSYLDSVEIKFGDVKTVAGMLTPVEVIGYDKYDNRVSWGLKKYDFKVSTGRFLREGAYKTGFTTNDFRNLNFYYQAPSNVQDESEAIIEIVESSEFNVNGAKTLGMHRQRLVQGALEIQLNSHVVLQGQQVETKQFYRLGTEESIYNDLQRLDLYMKDNSGTPIDVDSQVIVSNQNGLIVLGQLQKDGNGKDVFFETSKHYMSSGHVVLYYYPTKVAGDEVIRIEVPGLETRIINLTILPAPLQDIQFRLPKEVLQLGDRMTGEVFFMDKWGNLVDQDGLFKFYYDEDKIQIPGGKDGEVEKSYTKGYLDFQIIATGGGLAYIYGDGVYTNVMVDKHLFPQTGLNILYLNYFGDDWGNQWGYLSDNKKYIESLMNKSNKIITTTTQIASEDKIKKMLWKIGPGFKIWNPGNLDIDLVFKGNNFGMIVGDISVMQSAASLEWLSGSLEDVNSILSKRLDRNYAFFIPNSPNYSIDKKGVLYDGDQMIGSIMNGDISLSLSSSFLDNGDNEWDLIYKGTNYGVIVFHLPSFSPELDDFERPADRYLFSNTFSNGSTYDMGSIGLFDLQSDFQLNSNYKSIQNSDELQEQIGFLGDFKNITLFAEGEIVGEATKKFGSEFVINLGDPVLSRKTKNQNVYGTNYDGGIGQEIFEDSENQIFGTYQIDFNADGKKDLLVVYLDGTIKLAKNYGGNPDLRNLQDLMRIAVTIENVFIGDVNGDKLEDIIVQTENNQLRVYLNDPKRKGDSGEFDVDGNLVCLNINVEDGEKSENPSDISGLYKLYMEDMDKDEIIDIVTYDEKGYVKVFYGGGSNYLSKDKYSCDEGRYARESKNTTVVASFDLSVPHHCSPAVSCNGGFQWCSQTDLHDNSMVHRDGLSNKQLQIKETQLPYYGITFDQDEITSMIKTNGATNGTNSSLSGAMDYILRNTDIDKLSKRGLENGAKYQDVSLYGGDVYTFTPISYLDPYVDPITRLPNVTMNPDPIYVYKTYVLLPESLGALKDGDKVGVIVTIGNVGDLPVENIIFGDVIQGPRNIYFDENDVFEGIRLLGHNTGSKLRENRSDYIYNYYFNYGCEKDFLGAPEIMKRDGQFAYFVRKEKLGVGESFSFGYELEYREMKVKDMSLNYDEYWNADEYPDIKMQSVDGCEKDFLAFVNKGKSRVFVPETVQLQKEIDKSYGETLGKSDDYSHEINDIGSDANALPGIVGDSISRIQLINAGELEVTNDAKGKKKIKDKLNDILLNKIKDGDLATWNLDIDVNLSIFENEVEKLENIVDDITKGMCEGFSFGSSENCQGLPVPFNQAFFAPGKYHLFGCWDLPLGRLEKGLPVFFFPGTVYAGPVPIPVPNALKSPADDFLWVGGGELPSMVRIYAAPTLTSQLGIAVCRSPDRIWRNVPSPISDIMGNCVVFAVKPNCKAKNNDDADPDNPNETYPEIVETVRDSKTCTQTEKGVQVITLGKRSSPLDLYGDFGSDLSFLGIIELESSSFVGPLDTDVENSIMIGDVEILGGDFDVNKIKGGIQQGLKKLLIDKWLDPQIRYIQNQLTKMHVNIKLPAVNNLVGNEIEVLNDVVQSFGGENGEDVEEDDKENVFDVLAPGSGGNKDLISRWKSISYETLDDFNKEIQNPFESLASLMNQSNIINISTETIVVKVPFIMNEDIASYSLYLQQWLDENKSILKEWESVINSLVGSCSNKTLKEAEEMCKLQSSDNKQSCIETTHKTLNDKCLKDANEFRASLIEFQDVGGDWERMENQIYTNLLILQKYRNFPFEIYEWIHVIDRYMAEITSLIADTFGYLVYWTSQNAERFVGYVDALVLMLNIIKTYQVIVNFSVERSQNCGNCAKDTYDQYSCKLSLLCDSIELPIIQIPNFKLPNITIDLSNIDLGLDIVLPEFNFQTVRIDLPQLPNLPHPPVFGANIKLFDLPNIPQLPEPPHLPELPSFIPEVELELPILPPAPELPKIPNELEALIKVADLIGKIYCIVKGNFGLVGESSVKAKIEQLTQRTYSVDWIDNIMDFTNFTAHPIKNYGVDYEISSYVDFQYNLTDFYSFMDSLTTNINYLTTSVVNDLQDSVNEKAESVFNEEIPIINKSVSDIKDGVDNADVQLNVNILGKNGSIDSDFAGIKSDEIEYVDYSSAKSRLQEVLAYFRKEGRNTTLTDKLNSAIDKIENQISTPSVIKSNDEGINKVKDQAIEYIETRKSEYADLAKMINDDYEGFLAMIDSDDYGIEKSKSSVDSGKFLTFDVNLFNLDYVAKENLKNLQKENPYASLLDNKKDIIDGYWKAVNKNSAEDLGLTQSQYLVLRDDILKMKMQLADFYTVVKPAQSTKLVAKKEGTISDATLLAAANAAVLRNPKSSEFEQFEVDPAGFAEGIYEKIVAGRDVGKLAKVIYSDSFVSSIGNNYFKTSREEKHDIIMWTKKAIYKKCFKQNCLEGGNHYSQVYVLSKSIEEIPYEERWIKFDSKTRLKIADGDQEVKNWKVKGQTYDYFTLSWRIEDVDAYLIKLVSKIDTSYEKSDRNNEKVSYILVLPDGSESSNDNKLELVNSRKYAIGDLLESNQLVEISSYNKNRSEASIMVTGPVERKWYYANIATLKFDDKEKTYNINSPWSNQIVAGKQIVGDDQEPCSEQSSDLLSQPYLYRVSTKDVVSEGDDLDGYVGTEYTLNIPWKDNVALSYINVSKGGKIIKEKYTNEPKDSLVVTGLFRTKSGVETYNTVGIDQFGNKAEKTINVHYLVPDITITDVQKNQDGESVSIIAVLSQDIDTGNVSFQRKRGENWKTMKTKDSKEGDFAVGKNQTTVRGSSYSVGDKIALYDNNDSVIALIDPNTAEIILQDGYKDIYEIRVLVEDAVIIRFYNKKTKKFVFSLSLPIQEFVKVDAKGYEVSRLSKNGNMGIYNGGWAIYNRAGETVLLISPLGNLHSDYSLEGSYKYDKELKALELWLYQHSDTNDKKSPIKLWLRVEPFESK